MSKQKIGAVILSRYSSSRLPGKALMEIEGKTILQYIIERLMVVMPKEDIIIATSVETSDDAIAEFAKNMNVGCYRGSLENVAQRFFEAANSKNWDYAIRINGDNIFVDTNVLAAMIDIAQENKYEFISNVKNRTFPKGMSVEIVKVDSYKNALTEIYNSDQYREHVTLYLYDNEETLSHKYYMNTQFIEAAGLQFALDTKEDFERSTKIIQQFKDDHTTYNLKEIFKIYQHLN